MPSKNSHLNNPDPIVINKIQCEDIISSFLQKKEFEFKVVDTKNDADLHATKLGWKLLIEARGNQAKGHGMDTVFDSTQIGIHLAEQVQLMLKLYERMDDRTILVMANPDIPRIRQQVERIAKALSDLRIAKLWVQKDKNVTVEYPHSLSAHMELLGF
jgi:hypothetical protein